MKNTSNRKRILQKKQNKNKTKTKQQQPKKNKKNWQPSYIQLAIIKMYVNSVGQNPQLKKKKKKEKIIKFLSWKELQRSSSSKLPVMGRDTYQ